MIDGTPRDAEEVRIVADSAAAADEAAAVIARILVDAVAERGRADWATTGGSTPGGIYDRLARPPLVDDIPWDAVHVWWGDDRYVPPDDPRSNVLPLREHLLDAGVPLPASNVHPMRGSPSAEPDVTVDAAAEASAADLLAAGPSASDGVPVFDLVLLGIGPDGHILSVFPGSTTFASSELVLPIAAPTHVEPQVERLTMHPDVVGAARRVVCVVTGAAKAPVVREIFGPVDMPVRWPAQLARRAGATWIVDAAAAGLGQSQTGDAAPDVLPAGQPRPDERPGDA